MDMFPTFWAMFPGAVDAFTLKMRNAIAAELAAAEKAAVDPVFAAARISSAPVANRPRMVGRTAVVDISGPIFKRAGQWARYGVSGSAEIADAFGQLQRDKGVDNVVAYVDSPGGDVDGIVEASESIARTNATKPVVVQARGMIASGAYWLASNATAIHVGPMDLVGSIGVRMALLDTSRLYANAGVEVIPIDTGEHKSAGLDGVKITDAQKAEFQKIVDGYFSAFLGNIQAGRGTRITAKSLAEASDGRMFFPADAQRLGLIDGVQSPEKTLADAVGNTQRRTGTARARLSLILD